MNQNTVDLTSIALTLISLLFPAVTLLVGYWITSHMKDKQAAETVFNAVRNSLGVMQQAATTSVQQHPLVMQMPGSLPKDIATALTYVLNHAGEEAERLGITPQRLADKIQAQAGLMERQAALNAAANAAAQPRIVVDAEPARVAVGA